MNHYLPILLAIAGSLLLNGRVSAQLVYVITDLGVFPGSYRSQGAAINIAGQVAGLSSVGALGTPLHAFRTRPGGLVSDPGTDLGTLGGTDSSALAINASGQVTGFSGTAAFRTTATGRISDPGTDLGYLPGGSLSTGFGINTTGQVTGYSTVSGGTHAYRTTATGRISDPGTDLGVFSGGRESFGQGINDSGQVAGYSEYSPPVPPNPIGPTRAFRTTPTGRVSDAGGDLGTLGGSQSRAYGINGSGQVAGEARTLFDAALHAFRSTPNGQPATLTDLGTLGGTLSRGYAINSLGVLVGESSYTPGQTFPSHAFVYDTQMRDLNLLIPPGSGWELGAAYGINDAGQITGVGGIAGQAHAFLLTPIPEPSTILLVGLGAGVFGWRSRRTTRG